MWMLIYTRVIFLLVVCHGAPPWFSTQKQPSAEGDKPYEDAAVVIGLLREHFEAEALNSIKQSLTTVGFETHDQLMIKVQLNDKALCNDGSPAGYYIRKSKNSKKWIIFLDGGWYCFDEISCKSRWRSTRHMMSSAKWPHARKGDGILSSDPLINPHWWRSNHIHIPYCSSDCWSGTTRGLPKTHNGTESLDFSEMSFLGSFILEEVINDLIKQGLQNGHSILLAGSSAGGVGVMLNIDRIQNFLVEKDLTIDVRGVSDSAWFLDNEPFAPFQCNDALSCATVSALQKGVQTWKGRVPETCLSENGEAWKCYLAYKNSPLIKAPLFIFQWIFDEAQMLLNNVGKPVTKQHWNYIHKTGQAVRKSLQQAKVVFAPSCISHGSLTSPTWGTVKVKDVSLSDALDCWSSTKLVPNEKRLIRIPEKLHLEADIPLLRSDSLVRDDDWYAILPAKNMTRKKHKKNKTRKKGKKRHRKKRNKRKLPKKPESALQIDEVLLGKSNLKPKMVDMLADSPKSISAITEGSNKKIEKRRRKKHRKEKAKKRQRRKWLKKRRKRKRKQRKLDKDKRKKKSEKRFERATNSVPYDGKAHNASTSHLPSCQLHLIDECTWPHCNPTCPPLINPFSGEEMSRVQLLKSFGLDMTDFAEALGVDIPTLKSMDNKDIVLILAP